MMEIFLPTNGVMVRRLFAFQRQSSCTQPAVPATLLLLHHHLHTTAPLSILYCGLSVAVAITLSQYAAPKPSLRRLSLDCKCPPMMCPSCQPAPLWPCRSCPVPRWFGDVVCEQRRLALYHEIWSSVIMAEKFLQPWCWKHLLNY